MVLATLASGTFRREGIDAILDHASRNGTKTGWYMILAYDVTLNVRCSDAWDGRAAQKSAPSRFIVSEPCQIVSESCHIVSEPLRIVFELRQIVSEALQIVYEPHHAGLTSVRATTSAI